MHSSPEMNGFLELKCDIIRGGMDKYLTPMGPTKLHVHPIFEIGPLEPRYSEWLGKFRTVWAVQVGRPCYSALSAMEARRIWREVSTFLCQAPLCDVRGVSSGMGIV